MELEIRGKSGEDLGHQTHKPNFIRTTMRTSDISSQQEGSSQALVDIESEVRVKSREDSGHQTHLFNELQVVPWRDRKGCHHHLTLHINSSFPNLDAMTNGRNQAKEILGESNLTSFASLHQHSPTREGSPITFDLITGAPIAGTPIAGIQVPITGTPIAGIPVEICAYHGGTLLPSYCLEYRIVMHFGTFAEQTCCWMPHHLFVLHLSLFD
jgi:hypothetical protein